MLKIFSEINGHNAVLNTDDFIFRRLGVIMIDGPIDNEMASAVNSAALAHINSSEGPIILMINSPGGSITAGLSIHDTLKSLDVEIYTVCSGIAASMGAFLLATVGKKGFRFVQPNAEVLIHQPLGGISGQATDIKVHADHILKTKNRINKLLAEATGQSIEKIEQDCERDYIMDAGTACDYGIADQIGDPFGRR